MATKKISKNISEEKTIKEEQRRYELLVVYPLSENEIAVEKSVAEMCKKSGFTIVEVDKWGVKNLAYEINKESKGYYLRFVLEKGKVKELERFLKIDDKILRYIIVRI